MLAEGADVVDVGGESTRPGAQRVPADEEIRRVVPVVRGLVAAGAVVSIDTMRRETAEAALAAGARIVNDVSGGAADPELPRLVADAGVPYIVMHWRAHSAEMSGLRASTTMSSPRCGASSPLGSTRWSRPGSTPTRSSSTRVSVSPSSRSTTGRCSRTWTGCSPLGRPVLVGASRKSFLGSLLAAADGTPRDFELRDDATTAISAIAAVAGVWGVRVHEVRASADAVMVAAALTAAGGSA